MAALYLGNVFFQHRIDLLAVTVLIIKGEGYYINKRSILTKRGKLLFVLIYFLNATYKLAPITLVITCLQVQGLKATREVKMHIGLLVNFRY